MGSGFSRIKYARDVVLGGWLVLVLAAPVAAQTPPNGVTAAPEGRESIIIGGNQPSTPTLERCVDVEIGGSNAFSCLNQKLKREVDRVNPSLNVPPLDAHSPDVKVGNVNEAAVRQQYGSNYGRSVTPFRPAPQVFVPPHR
jgi:hypothetical protein